MTEHNFPQLPPSGIGEAARHNFSPWFIKLRFQDKSPIEGRHWKAATKPLSTLQSKIGNEFEERVYELLEQGAHEHVDSWFERDISKNAEQIIEKVNEASERDSGAPIMLTQARLNGKIKAFEISGDADLILLFPTEEGVHIHVIDIKSSWDEKPYQQLQTATYTLLLQDVLSELDIEYTIGGGIIYRETELSSVLKREETPSFHLETREGDVQRILRDDGPFARAFTTDFDELPLTIEKTSPYAEVTIVEAIESGDLSLLDLSPGEKSKLKKHGIETLSDIAELYELIEDAKPYEYDEPPINPTHLEKVRELKEDASLSTRFPILAQRAQALLGDLNPDHAFAHDKPWYPWLQGVGSAALPEDNPPYETELPVERDSLIRVYLNIQHDHVRDTIVAISGRVDCGLYDKSPLTFSRVVDDIDRDPSTWGREYERRLLEHSISDIFNTIQLMAGMTNQMPHGAIHFYVYGQDEYDAIYESVKRHENTVSEAAAMRSLLDARGGIDQSMVSVVEPEIENKFAVKQMDTSLPVMVQRTYPSSDSAKLTDDDWTVTHEDGDKISLKDAFNEQFFDTFTPIEQGRNTSARVLTRYSESSDADNFYALVPRSGAQIPIEYLWASKDIDILDSSWSNDEEQQRVIESFQWVDRTQKNTRITPSLFKLLSSRLAHALHHVERSISYRSTDIEKETVDFNEIPSAEPSTGTFAEACREYLDLESQQQRDDAYDVYMEPVDKRIIDGESVPIRVTNILQDEGYMFRAEGELLFDEFGFDNPVQIAGASRIGGSDETTGGTRCVATPLVQTEDGFKTDVSGPNEIARSVKVSVEDYDPKNKRIVIDGYRLSSKLEFEYVLPRPNWTLEEGDEYRPYIGPNEMFVLDPNPDNTMAEKSIKALRHADSNPVYQDIQTIRNSNIDFEDTSFTEDGVKEYIDWAKDALEFKPNKSQQKFITETSRYSLLQGPPGTGKTSGATAHSLLARAYDGQQRDERITGLITGLSNKSVDEVLSDVVETLDRFDSEFGEHCLENTRIIRLAYNEPQNSPDHVEYLNYQKDEDIDLLRNLIMPVGQPHQQTLTGAQSTGIEHVFVFATPGRVDGLIKNLFPTTSAEEGYETAYNFFDVLAIDEASMMPMYQLFMTSAFIKDDAQVMIAGDQRQLLPVQQYEWMDESRTSITHHMPYLSVLDYFRYLRGDDVDGVHEDAPSSPNANIPIARLNETFRCHETVTDFLRLTVYEQDGIEYVSNQTETMSETDIDVEGLKTALEADSPLTLIVHSDRKSRQVNPIEGTMLSALTDAVPESESIGIVTPHNAQKGKLNVICDHGVVDTVERFQGGEKDVMFLSTTVSDPSHLSDEEEFILSQNRLNVALSRMKKKLVVLAPESIFELVPDDVEVYDQARIWKALYAVSAADSDPEWTGSVGEFSGGGSMLPGANTELSVYNVEELE